MSDDIQNYIPSDLERIEFDDKEGLKYWLAELGCSRDALFSAVEDVGFYTKDIRSYLVLNATKLPQPK